MGLTYTLAEGEDVWVLAAEEVGENEMLLDWPGVTVALYDSEAATQALGATMGGATEDPDEAAAAADKAAPADWMHAKASARRGRELGGPGVNADTKPASKPNPVSRLVLQQDRDRLANRAHVYIWPTIATTVTDLDTAGGT